MRRLLLFVVLVVVCPSASAELARAAKVRSDGQFATTVDVRAYGATGNGVTDDTAALQQLIDASAGKRLHFPGGVYRISGLRVAHPVWLDLADDAALSLIPGSNRDALFVSGNGVMISGGKVDGGRGGQSTSGTGIAVVGARDVTVRAVRVENVLGWGIYGLDASGLTISDVTIAKARLAGIFVEAASKPISGITVTHSRVERRDDVQGAEAGGIIVHGRGELAAEHVEVLNNQISMPGTQAGPALAIELWGKVADARVSRNRVVGGSMGISLDSTVGAVVDENVIEGSVLAAIELAASSKVQVRRNTIVGRKATLVGVALNNHDSAANVIQENHIVGTLNAAIKTNVSTKDLTIAGNFIRPAARVAFEFMGSHDVEVLGNTIDGSRRIRQAVLVDESRGVVIRRNVIRRFPRSGVVIYADEPVVLNQLIITRNEFEATRTPLYKTLYNGARARVVFHANKRCAIKRLTARRSTASVRRVRRVCSRI